MLSVKGELRADFDRAEGRTRLRSSFHQAPLKLSKTVPMDCGQIGVCVMDCSPGMMAGDQYRMLWRLGKGSKVFLTNQSFTKVHPSQGRPSGQWQRFEITEDALMECRPEPVILFQDAEYQVKTEVLLNRGGSFVLSDVVCPGRTARGELFQYRLYENELRVLYEDELIFFNRQRFEPSRLNMDALPLFGQYTHFGSFYVFSDRIESKQVDDFRSLGESFPQLYLGVSLTDKHGIAVSALGNRSWEIMQLFRALGEYFQQCRR